MSAKDGTALTDAKAMGGILAQDGFDYQSWDVLARLPRWLRNPAFEGFIVEGLEDAEARFFAPQAPRGIVLERFQAKSGVLDRAGLVEVFESFRDFEIAHTGAARVQTLVTPALPSKLTWLARDPGRIRRARPFYSPFGDIRAASDEKLRIDLVTEFGSDLGEYLAGNVEISLKPILDQAMAEAAFSAELQREFEEVEISARKCSLAFSGLLTLTTKARGSMLSRSLLLDALRDALGIDLISQRHALPIHVRSSSTGEATNAIEVDGSPFSGGPDAFPDQDLWCAELLKPLTAISAWARAHNFAKIVLSGSYRLSTGFALGSAFRSAAGFEIQIPTKTGPWVTDAHPGPNGPVVPWSIKAPSVLYGDRLLIGIGVIRDPAPDMVKTWGLVDDDAVLLAFLPQAILGALEAQVSVQVIKSAIVEVVGRLKPSSIDLCFVGPAALSVALGHRWNALPPTQLYEYLVAQGRYVPTVLLR